MLVEAKGHRYLSRVMVGGAHERGFDRVVPSRAPAPAGGVGVEIEEALLWHRLPRMSSAGVVSARSGAWPPMTAVTSATANVAVRET